jgi:hypothetical protein
MIDLDRRRLLAGSLAAAAVPSAPAALAHWPSLPAAADFAPLVGSSFSARPLVDGGAAPLPLPLTLAAVESSDARSFALRFDVLDGRAAQATYALEHPALVAFGALLVPNAHGDSLTGIFNRG